MGKEQLHHPDLMQVTVSVPGLGHCVSALAPLSHRGSAGALEITPEPKIVQTFGVSWEVCITLEPGSKPSSLGASPQPCLLALCHQLLPWWKHSPKLCLAVPGAFRMGLGSPSPRAVAGSGAQRQCIPPGSANTLRAEKTQV